MQAYNAYRASISDPTHEAIILLLREVHPQVFEVENETLVNDYASWVLDPGHTKGCRNEYL